MGLGQRFGKYRLIYTFVEIPSGTLKVFMVLIFWDLSGRKAFSVHFLNSNFPNDSHI
jgi:hypothetical protein